MVDLIDHTTETRNAAYASFVDVTYLEGFLVLLRSLVLENPHRDNRYIVFHDGLKVFHRQRIIEIYPNVKFQRVDSSVYSEFKKGDKANYLVEKAFYILEVFKLRGYDRIVVLDTDCVILGNIDALFMVKGPIAACPALFDNPTGKKINSGVLVLTSSVLTDPVWNEILAVGKSGEYELDKHDQGILTEIFGDIFNPLDPKYNSVKRRHLRKVPDKDVRVLHFTGELKPWVEAEVGYERLQNYWEKYHISLGHFLWQAVDKCSRAGNHTLAVPFARRYAAQYNASMELGLRAMKAFMEAGLGEECIEWIENDPAHMGHNRRDLLRFIAMYSDRQDREQGSDALLLYALMMYQRDYAMLPDVGQRFWIEGEHRCAMVVVRRALAEKPYKRSVRALARRVQLAQGINDRRTNDAPGSIAHAAFYMHYQGNAGDTVLPHAVRRALDPKNEVDWTPIHVHQKFRKKDVEELNSQRQRLIIGGGGLLIPDTGQNMNSGWQWNIGIKELESIDVPISVFGVGYNRFFGQEGFNESFEDHINLLVSKTEFFGLRNLGSIKSLKEHLRPELHQKVEYQPCPTTLIRMLYPELMSPSYEKSYIALNLALDRGELRYGERYTSILAEIAKIVNHLRAFREVRLFVHAGIDEQCAIDLARYEGVSLTVDNLSKMGREEIIKKYQEPAVVIGMRGHAGLIPFGCGVPIVALVTHPKLGYFMDDVSMSELAIYLNGNFSDRVIHYVEDILERRQDYCLHIDKWQRELSDITQRNVKKVFGHNV